MSTTLFIFDKNNILRSNRKSFIMRVFIIPNISEFGNKIKSLSASAYKSNIINHKCGN